MLSRFHPIPELHGQTDGRTDRFAISKSRVKPTMPGCQRIPQRRPDELVANSETGNMGSKKMPGFACLKLSRSVCHEVCPVRDCSAPVGRNFLRRHCLFSSFLCVSFSCFPGLWPVGSPLY